jgi:DNA-binding GntR family transcriptional regulator
MQSEWDGAMGLSRSERAYERLTREVLRGRWQPGETLSTYALAEEMQISRTPILEALKRMESDGLIEIIPQVGCRVARPSTQSINELFAIRGALEGLAAEQAAQQMTDVQLAKLGQTLHRMEQAAASAATRDDAKELYYDLHKEFHSEIVAGSNMTRLIQTTQSIWALLQYQFARLPTSADGMMSANRDHRAIYEALRRREAEQARSEAEQHVRRCGSLLVAEMERNGARNSLTDETLRDATSVAQ